MFIMSLFGSYTFGKQTNDKKKGPFDDFLSKQPSPYHENFAHRKRSVAISGDRPPGLTAIELEQGDVTFTPKRSTRYFAIPRPLTKKFLIVIAILSALSLLLLLLLVHRYTTKRKVIDDLTDSPEK